MKYFVISDIHGSYYYFEKAIEYFKKSKCDKIIILGDILYHGPRNDLPYGHNVKNLVSILNQYKDYIIAVKGNCDAEVDQMVLDFKIHDEYNLNIDGINYYLIHGQHLDFDDENNSKKGKVILYGHTHIYDFKNINGIYYFNPGSISIPKVYNEHTFAIIENKTIKLYDFEGNRINEYEVE